ncbi:RNA-directed DNA polymerase, eukaryota, reverse transcriptase zinc-binding domain protein [Tanacetum coccineum]|uniref:RNA-directed DNA polymerase, eukaryota, reverse transcriptase zinc-binding domain protein n=1 Tax=Tanacetum coccineum TaxID=301880 RepID=A0ABQ5A6M0_9ASTR
MSVCNEKGERFEGSLVAEQFVNHFQKFLGPNEKRTDINTHNLFTTKISPGHDGYTSAFFRVLLERIYMSGNQGVFYFWQAIRWIMTCVSSTTFTIGINGERYGYFKSGRGLRKGDPISPYLFTLIMEVFSLMLARKVKEKKKFKFHKGCKEMKLTHLLFADDLLVLCHGDVNSVIVIKEALLEFSNSSGLKPNMEKSVVFFGSVKEVIKQRILQILPFKVGKLPVKYLGIPLLAKKIGINDCKQLVEKVKSRIQDWKNRHLSYAEKLQLIAAVLATMQTY